MVTSACGVSSLGAHAKGGIVTTTCSRSDPLVGLAAGILLLSRAQYASTSPYGYCRGIESVRYVSEIRARYNAYRELLADGDPDGDVFLTRLSGTGTPMHRSAEIH